MTAKKSAKPKLIKQPKGKGALYAGGVPGNKGGLGAIRSRVRKAASKSFEERLPILEEIADDKDERAAERIKAVLGIGAMGIGRVSEKAVSIDLDQLRALAAATQDCLADHGIELTEEVGDDLRERWLAALREE